MSEFNTNKKRQELLDWWDGDLNDTEILKSYREALDEIDIKDAEARGYQQEIEKLGAENSGYEEAIESQGIQLMTIKEECFKAGWAFIEANFWTGTRNVCGKNKKAFKQSIDSVGKK